MIFVLQTTVPPRPAAMLMTVLWREGQQREPHATGYESENTIHPQKDSPGPNVPGNQCQWLILWSVFSSDPMLLPDVVNNILEFLDGDTLLTGRLVSRLWRTKISERNGLWRRRYEQLGAHEPGNTFAPETSFCHVYKNLKRMFCQMARETAWKRIDRCSGSRFQFHKERERYSHWVCKRFPDVKQREFIGKKTIICRKSGELLVLDEETKRVAWRTWKHTTDVFTRFDDFIFTVTFCRNIELYSLDVKCEERDTGGMLQGVWKAEAHPTAHFLVVSLKNETMFLVNDKMEVFPLKLPYSKSPEEESEQEEEIKCLKVMYLNVDHNDEQVVAMAIDNEYHTCVVIYNKVGKILHKRFFKTEIYFPIEFQQGGYRILCVNEWIAETFSVHVSSMGITVDQLWKKAIPARIPTLERVGYVGRKFLLSLANGLVRVYRMDNGRLVAYIPVVCNIYRKHSFPTTRTASSMAELFVDINSTTGAIREHDKTMPDMLFIVNFDWLNGLSPANMRPDVPVAILFNNETPWGRCVHWSEGLWDKFPTS
ncbi:hypothetical protein ACOMHN_007248 [Nucella lapillus]